MLSIEIEEEYDMLLSDQKFIKKRPYNIHTFWSIGMADPFPDASTIFEADKNGWIGPENFSHDVLVYPK